MNKVIVNQYIPDYVSPPGETLLETIEELGISQDDLAKRINITKKEVDEIIAGKAAIRTELALQLDQVLGIPASFWNNRERNYRDALARRLLPQSLNFSETELTSKSMTQQPIKPKQIVKPGQQEKTTDTANSVVREKSQTATAQAKDIVKEIKDTIDKLSSLKDYPIRDLVKHAEEFGPYLKNQRLETNQIRKFLDAVNQLKARLAQDEDETIKQGKTEEEKAKLRFGKIESDVVLLKPKLAYAAARQKAAKPLSDVMSAALDKVYSSEDFDRLVQLIESIIAYHKAEGGK
ncbi:type III-A CRISPR-associated protein Csm2 [Argonema galeatum]|uniref:type III-A CRISPR-associated protein Csm2 n=1 Tax=Argonema galeatum TaxID=2942762 RepID=UPI00201130B9|nr:type III-A CRISPR-associated protein Csm2 [Argonema galeatum]MCL1465975.1 type III-A CRISPR-associated protein Csm2 [Argonema galeatum A003/A1]